MSETCPQRTYGNTTVLQRKATSLKEETELEIARMMMRAVDRKPTVRKIVQVYHPVHRSIGCMDYELCIFYYDPFCKKLQGIDAEDISGHIPEPT